MKVLSLLSAVSLAVACHQLTENAVSAPRNVEVLAGRCTVSPSEDPFQCVKRICEDTAGIFDSRRHECVCGAGRHFDALGGEGCTDTPVLSSCLTDGFRNALDEGNSSFLKCLEIAKNGASSIRIHDVRSGTELWKTANWADAMLTHAHAEISDIPTLFQPLVMRWLVGPGKLDDFGDERLLELTQSVALFLHPPSESYPVSFNYYFYDNDAVEGVMAPDFYDGRIQISVASGENRNLSEDINAAIRDSFQWTRWKSFTANGCLGHCELSVEKAGVHGFTVRTRKYFGGNFLSDIILVYPDARKIRATAMVSLLPSGQVSLIHVFKESSSPDAVVLSQMIYDRMWYPLLSNPLPQPVVSRKTILPSQIGLMPKTVSADTAKAILCESGLNSDLISALGTSQFVAGPFATNRSMLGWIDAGYQADSSAQWASSLFLSGVEALNEMGFKIPFSDFSGHLQKVARNLAGEQDVKMIPIGQSACSQNADKWWDQVKPTGVKVVNWSATENISSSTCAQSTFALQIRERAKDLLYVLPAGNDGLNAETTPPQYCPQALSGNSNVIVVSSGTPWKISLISNYGPRYSDIVAEGAHEMTDPQSYATSFATPRVSRVAALLAAEFPELSIADIRKAILFGAQVPAGLHALNPLPVRSGGFLNEQKAREMAKRILLMPGASDLELLRKTYCWGNRASCEEQMLYYNLYRKNGLIS